VIDQMIIYIYMDYVMLFLVSTSPLLAL